jgi:class 3 adenylate cyclase
VVLAPRDSSLEGILLAATRPDRVSGLILINGLARWARADDYPVGVPQRILDTFIKVNMEPDAVSEGFDFLATAAPSVAHDDSFRAWWVNAGYRGASPSRAREIQRVIHEADVRSSLPLVRVPTLVLHRRDDNLVRVGHGRFIAEQMPNARYVELPGADNLYWVGDTSEILDEIEEFVTGVRHGPDAELVLAGVLFSDIVESTRRMAELGERAWQELMDRHDLVVRRQIERYRGRQVKSTGDGVLATFDGPLAAVTCGRAIRDAAAQLDLTVRVGVHVGQIELRAADIGGMAVHIAARAQAHAQPGQIIVTRTVVDIAVGAGLKFRPQGSRVLRGVPGRWQLYSVEG